MTGGAPILTKSRGQAIPLLVLTKKSFGGWLKKQPASVKNWLEAVQFSAEPGQFTLLAGKNGKPARVFAGIGNGADTWSIAHLPTVLPPHTYALEGELSQDEATLLSLGWALGGYQFTHYKKKRKPVASLVVPKQCDAAYVESMATAMSWARDLINIPANDMHPAALANEAAQWGKSAGGIVNVIKGEALLKANYPTIYTVGKASSVPPHFVEIRFPKKGAKKVALVGKGVCFDSGGLDIKPASNMKLMKKDMAGTAIVLALAKTLLESEANIDLRLLLPIVENAVGSRAMRPLDIVRTRKGITVEIGNTDAEGRLILCDALFEADEDEPDLIVDFTTLTGAARVAVGTEISAFFTPDDDLAAEVMEASKATHDPMWRLPLWKPYRSMLDTPAADLSNDPESSYAAAITAALYLQEFVSKTASWLHIDMMAWNLSNKPGRPVGGEPMALRAVHALILSRYGRAE